MAKVGVAHCSPPIKRIKGQTHGPLSLFGYCRLCSTSFRAVHVQNEEELGIDSIEELTRTQVLWGVETLALIQVLFDTSGTKPII